MTLRTLGNVLRRAPGPAASPQQHRSGYEPRPDASYEARAVVPPEPGTLHEEERIGSYGQPRWTAHRRFPTTRVYVQRIAVKRDLYSSEVSKRWGD